jgi:hypothetical protein
MWLNFLVDAHQCGNITKLQKAKTLAIHTNKHLVKLNPKVSVLGVNFFGFKKKIL